MSTEEIVDKTPGGGVRALFIYTNDEGKDVPKEEATNVEIREYDKKGRCIRRTYGEIAGKDTLTKSEE